MTGSVVSVNLRRQIENKKGSCFNWFTLRKKAVIHSMRARFAVIGCYILKVCVEVSFP